MIKKYLFLVVLIFSVFLISAEGKKVSEDECPYESQGKMYVYDEKVSGSCFKFKLSNVSDEDFTGFSVVLGLYDSNGEPAFDGRDLIHLKFTEELCSGEEKEFVILLDEYFSADPEYEYGIDYFYCEEIKMSSGTVWKDPFGRFSI